MDVQAGLHEPHEDEPQKDEPNLDGRFRCDCFRCDRLWGSEKASMGAAGGLRARWGYPSKKGRKGGERRAPLNRLKPDHTQAAGKAVDRWQSAANALAWAARGLRRLLRGGPPAGATDFRYRHGKVAGPQAIQERHAGAGCQRATLEVGIKPHGLPLLGSDGARVEPVGLAQGGAPGAGCQG